MGPFNEKPISNNIVNIKIKINSINDAPVLNDFQVNGNENEIIRFSR